MEVVVSLPSLLHTYFNHIYHLRFTISPAILYFVTTRSSAIVCSSSWSLILVVKREKWESHVDTKVGTGGKQNGLCGDQRCQLAKSVAVVIGDRPNQTQTKPPHTPGYQFIILSRRMKPHHEHQPSWTII